MTYFKNVETLEELRKQYKELFKKHHPDNPNGSTEATQAINAEYDSLFKVLKDRHEKQTEGKTADNNNKHKYDFSIDEQLRNILQKIISFSGINIDIVGCFIWIDGNSYQYREQLKKLGFRWSAQRKKWYWHNGEYRKRGNKKLSYIDIQNLYGSTEVQTEEKKQLKQA